MYLAGLFLAAIANLPRRTRSRLSLIVWTGASQGGKLKSLSRVRHGGNRMRQLGIAVVFGIVGMVLAAVLVRLVAAGTTSISDSWLTAGAVLPVFGVVLGAFLSHRLSGGADPWPITERTRRIPFAVLGGVLGALTWYVSYVMLAALWNNQDFWALLSDPSAIPTLSSRRRGGTASSTPALMYIAIGLLAGAWVTDYAIKKKWTS